MTTTATNSNSAVNLSCDNDIRVSGGKKRGFIAKLLLGKPKSYEAADEQLNYDSEDLKDRNPIEKEGAKRKERAAASSNKTSNPGRFGNRPAGATTPKPTPTTTKQTNKSKTACTGGNKTNPLEGRNPVDFDKANVHVKGTREKQQRKDSYNTNPLEGRNPVDFDKANVHVKGTKKNQQRKDSLAGRNPVDFDSVKVESEIKGNRGSDNFLDGRNPRDFDGCDPYGKNQNIGKDSLTGRNPKDFESAGPYNPKKDSLAGRNPRDFDGCDSYGNPLKSRNDSSTNPLEGRNPIDFDAVGVDKSLTCEKGTCCHHCPHCNANLPPTNNSGEVSPENLTKKNDNQKEESTLPVPITVEEPGSPYKINGKAVYLDDTERSSSETVELEHVETIKREIKKEVPVWAKVKLKTTTGGRDKKKRVPAKEREKFSLPTFHQPRSVPDTGTTQSG